VDLLWPVISGKTTTVEVSSIVSTTGYIPTSE
jgi:hypothetical protein